ncbi:complement C1q tumor necrosis factor-related protein 7-like isoform X1 [Argopecten irradians]|uniref:complement C1q tumor necrosis factor-related protein 7-like isoform X1 n=1 Tax=Argopecten irradians TaxID=31199 RepID=UPI0037220C1C
MFQISNMVTLIILFLIYSANGQIDLNIKNLQDQLVSLQTVVKSTVTDIGALRNEHRELQEKYSALWDQLSVLGHKNGRADSPDATKPAGPLGQRSYRAYLNTRASTPDSQNCVCTKGEKGASGPAGPVGKPGITGVPGERGPKGESGSPGFNGDDGLDGEKGDRGPKGDIGSPGQPGPKGVTGSSGQSGPKGDTGSNGQPGLKGDTGDTGATGQPGPKGDIGSSCQQGPKGETGATDHEKNIAFTAGVRNNMYVTLYGIIVYDDVNTNVGNAYNPATGKFTCIIPGIYVFSWSTEVNDSRYLKSELKVNGEHRLYLEVAAGIYANTGSATITLQLSVDDVVYISVFKVSHGLVLGMASSFSGYLLHAL